MLSGALSTPLGAINIMVWCIFCLSTVTANSVCLEANLIYDPRTCSPCFFFFFLLLLAAQPALGAEIKDTQFPATPLQRSKGSIDGWMRCGPQSAALEGSMGHDE